MKKLIILIFLILLLNIFFKHIIFANDIINLNETLDTVSIQNEEIHFVIEKLYRQYKIPIGFQSIILSDTNIHISNLIQIDTYNITIKNLLNEIINQTFQYSWDIYDSKIINIYPQNFDYIDSCFFNLNIDTFITSFANREEMLYQLINIFNSYDSSVNIVIFEKNLEMMMYNNIDTEDTSSLINVPPSSLEDFNLNLYNKKIFNIINEISYNEKISWLVFKYNNNVVIRFIDF